MPRYRQDRKTGRLILVDAGHGGRSPSVAPAIVPDITPFTSPIDGRTITSRRDLRVHNEEHGVIQHQEFGENDGQAYLERVEQQRVRRMRGDTPEDKQRRLNKIIEIVTAHER